MISICDRPTEILPSPRPSRLSSRDTRRVWSLLKSDPASRQGTSVRVHQTRASYRTEPAYRYGKCSRAGRPWNLTAERSRADPFETFSRFAAQMTIPCFTAARLGSDRGDLKGRLVVVGDARSCVSDEDPWRFSAGMLLFLSRAIPDIKQADRKGQCAAFSLPLPFSAITHAARRRAALDL